MTVAPNGQSLTSVASMRIDSLSDGAPSLIELSAATFRAGRKALVERISLRVSSGEFLAILGPNGAGKSTLLNLLDATLRPSNGAVRLFDRNPWATSERGRAGLRARIGFVPQRTDFNPLIPLTAREVVALGRIRGRAFASLLSSEEQRIVDDSLERMGVADLAQRVYRSLSGGEQQKVQLARALAQTPDVLLLDEPTSGLDLRWQEQLTATIEHLSATMRLPIVMTTHILGHLPACCRRAALMRDGRILFDGPVADALSTPRIADLYECPVEIVERDGRRHCLGATGRPDR